MASNKRVRTKEKTMSDKRKTCIHGNPPVACGPCKHPELYIIARELAGKLSAEINQRAREAKDDSPYKAQGILEMVIELLQKAV